MNECCPVCGIKFGREPGYFTGAMYISYTLGVVLLAALTLVIWLVSGWPLEWVLLAASLALVPCGALLFRYSRVIWLHLDRVVTRDF